MLVQMVSMLFQLGPGPWATGSAISILHSIQLAMLHAIRFFTAYVTRFLKVSFQTFKKTFKNILTGQVFNKRNGARHVTVVVKTETCCFSSK